MVVFKVIKSRNKLFSRGVIKIIFLPCFSCKSSSAVPGPPFRQWGSLDALAAWQGLRGCYGVNQDCRRKWSRCRRWGAKPLEAYEKDCQEEHQDSEDQAYSVPRLHNDLPTVAKGIMPLECPVSFGLDGLATRTGPTHDGWKYVGKIHSSICRGARHISNSLWIAKAICGLNKSLWKKLKLVPFIF